MRAIFEVDKMVDTKFRVDNFRLTTASIMRGICQLKIKVDKSVDKSVDNENSYKSSIYNILSIVNYKIYKNSVILKSMFRNSVLYTYSVKYAHTRERVDKTD